MDIQTSLSLFQVLIGVLGLLIVGGAATFIVKKKSIKQSQKSGNNSFTIQSGGDTKIDL